ncbi:MAG: tRNA epoxyqueuosine(34) reductase QueG, partial [Phycisphaerales bacterium]|nr:tRNA epoxyqueuosine(34) reductase QueG [Phycisphaerales bacterium]
IIKPRLHAIADWLRQQVPGSQTRCGVDTAPIPERELAARAGLGWIGKNTCVIHPRIGSWLFLGVVLTTIELPCDQPAIDRCGTCRRCIDACPTGALVEYQLDPRRCISYLTIEHRSEIDPSLRPLMGDWLFGCDICQEVCPWNRRAPFAQETGLQPRIPDGRLDLEAILTAQKQDFDHSFRRSAIKRIRLPLLQRNARIVLENHKKKALEPAGAPPGELAHSEASTSVRGLSDSQRQSVRLR